MAAKVNNSVANQIGNTYLFPTAGGKSHSTNSHRGQNNNAAMIRDQKIFLFSTQGATASKNLDAPERLIGIGDMLSCVGWLNTTGPSSGQALAINSAMTEVWFLRNGIKADPLPDVRWFSPTVEASA